MTRRRVMAALGTVATGAAAGSALAGCGAGSQPAKVAPAAATGKVEFWYGLNGDGVQPFIDDFKREFPNVELNFTVTSDHANKLYTASAAGAAPNVSTGWPGMLWTIEAAKQLTRRQGADVTRWGYHCEPAINGLRPARLPAFAGAEGQGQLPDRWRPEPDPVHVGAGARDRGIS